MPEIAGVDIDLSDRNTQLILGGGAAIGALYLWYSSRGQGSPDAAATAASQYLPEGDDATVRGRSGVPGWVGYPEGQGAPATAAPVTPPATQGACGSGKTAVWRDGVFTCRDLPEEPFSRQQCPPGYVAVKDARGARCTLAMAWGNPAGPNSFIPVNQSGAYVPGYTGSAQTGGVGGEAFPGGSSVDWLYQRGKGGDNPTPYRTVGGFSPLPRPLTAGGHAYVKPGETLGDLSRRVYGFEGWWPLLARKNGPEMADLQEGQRVRF